MNFAVKTIGSGWATASRRLCNDVLFSLPMAAPDGLKIQFMAFDVDSIAVTQILELRSDPLSKELVEFFGKLFGGFTAHLVIN